MDSPDDPFDFSAVFNIAPHLVGSSRSNSAPPELNIRSPALDDTDTSDPRFTKEYSEFYYSMQPRDPRLPPPFVSSRQWPSVSSMGFGNIKKATPLLDNEVIEDEALQCSINTLSLDQDDDESSVPNTPDDYLLISNLTRHTTPTRHPSSTSSLRPFQSRPPSYASVLEKNFDKQHDPGTLPSAISPKKRGERHHNFSASSSSFSPSRGPDQGRFKSQNISDFIGQISELCCDPQGSRFIQEQLDHCSNPEKEAVFAELRPSLEQMAIEPFGNYVIQKFFAVGLAHHIEELVTMLTGRIRFLTLQMYGCRVVQKAFTTLPPHILLRLVHELQGSVAECICDQNGNHVIQCAVETVSRINPKEVDFIIESIFSSCTRFASHAYGCRVIQRVLEHCSKQQVVPILDQLLASVKTLVNDQYGNYVCQHIIQYDIQAAERIFNCLVGNFVDYSKKKFSSNVVEQICKYMAPRYVNAIAHEFMTSDDVLSELMRDPFGNFVVQKVVAATDSETKARLVGKAKGIISGPKRMLFGRFITSFLLICNYRLHCRFFNFICKKKVVSFFSFVEFLNICNIVNLQLCTNNEIHLK
ncbi:hypothetical protein GEMRC1_011709 [Eukaryota sp. GEM-RC1]